MIVILVLFWSLCLLRFFANFTNGTSFGDSCNVSLNVTGVFDPPREMTLIGETWEFTNTSGISPAGQYEFSVNCTGFDNVTVELFDNFTISSVGGGPANIPEFSTWGFLIAIGIGALGVFYIRKRRMS